MRRSTERPPADARRRRVVPLATGVVVAVAVVLALTTWARTGLAMPTVSPAAAARPPAASPTEDPVVAPLPISAQQLAALPSATTFATVANAPKDPATHGIPSGLLVHPTTTVPAYTTPGGPAVASVPPTELVSDTWLPVVAQQPGWAEVLLPSRPNDTAAWIYTDARTISLAQSPYRIVVDREHFLLTLFRNNQNVGHWAVGVGAPGTPTPVTHTFILSSIKDTHPTYSPIILATGAHSDTYTTFGGGPGTVGIHTWPTPSVFGKQSSNGCVRIPAAALHILSSEVPIGSPVLIS
jgi:lipoprotein-anchoring transpeptidase ErfK/SrfK